MFLPSSDDPGSWDPAVEPSTCASEGQDLAKQETLEAETALVSNLHMRAVRVLTLCSIPVNATILVERALSICSTMVILEVRRPTAFEIDESPHERSKHIPELFELRIG